MKKINFLIKLRRKKTIQIADPSDEIKDSYLEKSESNLLSSKILLENNQLEESIALTYYSMYHTLTALLFKVGIKCENHAASIIILKELFEIENEDISNAKEERVDKQYAVGFSITKEDVETAIKSAEEFNSKIQDFISRLTYSDLKEYKQKFEKISID